MVADSVDGEEFSFLDPTYDGVHQKRRGDEHPALGIIQHLGLAVYLKLLPRGLAP
jgi:hypothetical protein